MAELDKNKTIAPADVGNAPLPAVSQLKLVKISLPQVASQSRKPASQSAEQPHSEAVTVRGAEVPVHFQPSAEYKVPTELWKEVYGRLTVRDLAFHHRDFPEMTPYGIVKVDPVTRADIAAAGKRPPPEHILQRKKRDAVEKTERENFKDKLLALAKKVDDPNAPRSDWEQRMEAAFAALPGDDLKKKITDATKSSLLGKPLIRAQPGVSNWVYDALERSQRWVEPMARVLQNNNLPLQLLAIPLIEGLFSESAISKSKAVGPWQIMPGTGKDLGLIRTKHFDERRDPILSTEAAAKHIISMRRELTRACSSIGVENVDDKQLWPLTLTSYNRGVGGIAKLVRSTKTCDLAEIVSREDDRKFDVAVKNYWPAFLAAIDIFQNREKYFPSSQSNLKTVDGEIFRLSDKTNIKTLKAGLSKAEVSYESFLAINPAIDAKASTLPKGARIRLPTGANTVVAAKLKLERTSLTDLSADGSSD